VRLVGLLRNKRPAKSPATSHRHLSDGKLKPYSLDTAAQCNAHTLQNPIPLTLQPYVMHTPCTLLNSIAPTACASLNQGPKLEVTPKHGCVTAGESLTEQGHWQSLPAEVSRTWNIDVRGKVSCNMWECALPAFDIFVCESGIFFRNICNSLL
jgi:hypothetical protein